MSGDRVRAGVDIDKPTRYAKLKWRRWRRRMASRTSRHEVEREVEELETTNKFPEMKSEVQ